MRPWRWWVELLSRQEPATPLALTRIGAGLCVLLTIGTPVAKGLVPALWFDAADGGYRTLGDGSWQVALLGGPTPAVVWSLVAVTMLAGVALTVGLGSRLSALLAGQGVAALVWTNTHAGGSHDQLLTNLLWLMVLADAGGTWSLSCRLRTGRWSSDRPVGAWARYLVIFQLVVAYSSTGIQKVSAYWVPGGDFSALYYILQQPTWQRTDMRWVAQWFPLTQAATAMTWFWEVTAPLLLLAYWYRDTRDRPGRLRAFFNTVRWRSVFAAFGVAMHLLTAALMEVGPFSWVTLSFYPCLFHPDEWATAGRRLRRTVWQSAGQRAATPATLP